MICRSKITVIPVLLMIFSFTAPAPSAAAAAPDENSSIRRFALIVGSNNGGADRVRLKYAHSDASSMARVLRDLGGVSRRDSMVLIEPTHGDLRSGFVRMRSKLEKARRAGERLELIFYYSGHSDENGLLLNGEHFTYPNIKKEINELPADVRIAVLDSCASGVLTRGKGGTRTAPFLLDSSGRVKGYAILTSASADETAQESERMGGSFFTHYLVSGLRGAADSSEDGIVTLNEAYHYAFHQTLARTESTQAGPQHANYDMQLAGSGDLVLTDLRGTSAILILAAELEGRIFIRDERGRLVAEIQKTAGQQMILGLEPGEYVATIEHREILRRGSVIIADGRKTELGTASLRVIKGEATIVRGSTGTPPAEDGPRRKGFRLSLVPGLSTAGTGRRGDNVITSFQLSALGHRAYANQGSEFNLIFALTDNYIHGAQFTGIFNKTGGSIRGLQAAGIFNMAGGWIRGVQVAGIFNRASSGGLGLQGAGILNLNDYVFNGVQFAGLANRTAGINGLQASGIVNIADGDVHGAQVSIANEARGQMRGLQAGFVNLGSRVSGVQLGLVNIAYEEMNGAPIGLINYAGDGIMAPAVWGSDTTLINLGLKMGSRYIYSILGAGVDPIGEDENRWASLITGIGGHIDFHPLWFEIDLVTHWLFPDYKWEGDRGSVSKLRFVLGYRPVEQLSLFVGPTLNLSSSETVKDPSLGYHFWADTIDDGHYMLYPGFVIGLQYEPQIEDGRLNAFYRE